jgi:hypothetical protein
MNMTLITTFESLVAMSPQSACYEDAGWTPRQMECLSSEGGNTGSTGPGPVWALRRSTLTVSSLSSKWMVKALATFRNTSYGPTTETGEGEVPTLVYSKYTQSAPGSGEKEISHLSQHRSMFVAVWGQARFTKIQHAEHFSRKMQLVLRLPPPPHVSNPRERGGSWQNCSRWETAATMPKNAGRPFTVLDV